MLTTLDWIIFALMQLPVLFLVALSFRKGFCRRADCCLDWLAGQLAKLCGNK